MTTLTSTEGQAPFTPAHPDPFLMTALASVTCAAAVQPIAPLPGVTDQQLQDLRDQVELSVCLGETLTLNDPETRLLGACVYVTLTLAKADLLPPLLPDLQAAATAEQLQAAFTRIDTALFGSPGALKA